ncbi:MAG: pyruvate kinase [Patescibacteria group bacterium]
MKFTKIVCTIGPASEKRQILEKLIKAGMNVARLNFSHGTYAQHARLIRNIRAAAKKCGEPVAILQDLQGPRIRIGEISAPEGIKMQKGEKITLVPQRDFKAKSTLKLLPNQYEGLAHDVKAGNHILIADGTMDLRVECVKELHITCSVVVGGTVKSHKGINVPGVALSTDAITEKDKKDVAFGIKQGVDYVALSFVSNEKDILRLRALMKRINPRTGASIGIIPKIERPEAVKRFGAILAVSDGIMVARGDLGIEVPAEKVPVIQKTLIRKCIAAHKPVIVATQMLESMTQNSRPTRAEVSDVANAVVDHTDAVMLSGESAAGLYPVEAVDIMARTLHETERSSFDDYTCGHGAKEKELMDMVAHAVADAALTKQIKLIVIQEDDEAFVRSVASHRPEVRIIAFSNNSVSARKLNLVRGVTVFPQPKNTFAFLKKQKLAKKGDLIAELERNELELERIS